MSRAKIFNYILKKRLDKHDDNKNVNNATDVTIFSNCSLRGLNFTQRSEGRIVDVDYKQDLIKLKSIDDSIVDIDLNLISYIQTHSKEQEFKVDLKKIKEAKKNQYDESDVKHTDDKIKITALKNASPGQKVMVLCQEANSSRLQSFIGIIEEIDWKHGFLCIWSQHGKNYCLILDTLICPLPQPLSSSSATSRSTVVESSKSSSKNSNLEKVNKTLASSNLSDKLYDNDDSKKSGKSKKSYKKKDKKDKHKKDKKDNESRISKLIQNLKD